jgi:hypothetical protein
MRLSELMRSSASADPDELIEKVSDLARYLEDNGDALEAAFGSPLASELQSLLLRLNSLGSVLDIVADSGGPTGKEI